MSLRELAEADNAIILEDAVSGFGVAITLTDLDGNVYSVTGQYTRVGIDIDPETGLLVPGNKSAVTVRLLSLGAGILPDDGWMIETTDITGAVVKGKATAVMLDRTAGRATMIMRK
jgi:hypothetical protein